MPVTLTIDGRTFEPSPGLSLFACAEQLGIRVPTSCHQDGRCKECLVEITEGAECLSPPTAAERHLQGAYRLSCQCRVTAGDGRVRGHTMRRGRMRIERQAPALAARGMPSPPDPAVTRDGGRVLLDGEEIDRYRGALHGIALDLGTSTVVLRLLDLATGEAVADTSFENPQRFAGSDVMARIQYAAEHGPEPLVRAITAYISRAIAEFPVDPVTIYEVAVAGNSTMRDLFFRKDVGPIGQSPYRSITEVDVLEGRRATTALADTGRGCGLPIHPDARVYGLPVISGHVGADAAGVPAGHRPRRRAIASRPSWTSAPTRRSSRAAGAASSRRRARPGRRSRAAASRAACPRSRAPPSRCRSARTAPSASASSEASRPRASAARGWSTC